MELFRRYLLLLLSYLVSHSSAQNNSGTALTNRYWDCCKPSCAWKGKAQFTHPVQTCDINDNPFTSYTQGTACEGGEAYTCTNQAPWAVNDTFSYGFSGVYIMKHLEDSWCCACYELTFIAGNGAPDGLVGKKMIVQGTNTGYDVTGNNKFALAIPGGNTSYAEACAREFGVSNSIFGTPNEGVSNRSMCDSFPDPLKAGCYWRWDWLLGADRPNVNYKRVQCPAILTNRTGCIRSDEKSFKLTSDATSMSPLHSIPIFTMATILLCLILL